jgi:acyl-CoA reductase-like NAD-dependent aldehyde dehydrogenase
MRIFPEEIFGPVLSVTTFKNEAEAMEIANDAMYGLGAGVWTRDLHQMQTLPRIYQLSVMEMVYPIHRKDYSYFSDRKRY